jgi:iron complex outermembrane recepter protein
MFIIEILQNKIQTMKPNLTNKILSVLILTFMSFSVFAQSSKISGNVKSGEGNPIVGASIVIKGTNKGTTTDANGNFSLEVSQNNTLVVSSIGFSNNEVAIKGQTNLSILLVENNKGLDEVVVTGVFDKRTALNSSIAISSINAVQIEKTAPISAADLLKNVPGVFVNTSLGEIRNTVYSRGVTTGNNDGRFGYDYVSMQEDGLPITNTIFANFGPDLFLRSDATLSKLEAVRGGTASITGANAPGGVFNYISKTGGNTFEGEIRAKFGLEGNGKNPYYRADFNLGGPLNEAKTLTYNIGGFYRTSDGPQHPTYLSNFGGQIKGNLLYKYKSGSLKFLVKILDDHNLTAEGIPSLGYTDMTPATGFDNTSSVLPPAVNVTADIPSWGSTTYNPSDLWHSQDKSFGLNWEQDLGNSWTFTNNARYTNKKLDANTPLSTVSPIAMDYIVTYFILGALHPPTQIIPGTYSIKQGGKEIMTVKSFSGFDYHVITNTAPGSALLGNSLFFTPLIYQGVKANEFMDQFNFTKRAKNMTFNIGGFLSSSSLDRVQGSFGVSLNTIENHPQTVNISVTDPTGKIYQVTNKDGIVNVGADQGFSVVKATQSQKALFFAHNWNITDKLNLDWGLRYENVNVNGTNNPSTLAPVANGGVDGNALTLYDNTKAVLGSPLTYDQTLSYVSYSGALNYKASNNTAIYVRYSNGKKAPSFNLYLDVTTPFAQSSLKPEVQVIQQYELGFKTRKENLSLTLTPFYSLLSHIPNTVTFTNATGALYNPPAFYNDIETSGIEIETRYDISKHFGIRGAITFQGSKATQYNAWVHNQDGTDTQISNSGNQTANVPKVMANITPEYSKDKFYANVTWNYMGERQANFVNSFVLPSYSQFNLAMGYNLTSKIKLSGNINNLFNQYGVMGWVGPGTFPDNLNLEGLSKAAIAKEPNAFHQTIAIPARAFFLTASYKF